MKDHSRFGALGRFLVSTRYSHYATGSVTEKKQPEIYVIAHSQALSPRPDLERCNTFHSYRDRKLWNLCLAGGLQEEHDLTMDSCNNKGFRHQEVCNNQPHPLPL